MTPSACRPAKQYASSCLVTGGKDGVLPYDGFTVYTLVQPGRHRDRLRRRKELNHFRQRRRDLSAFFAGTSKMPRRVCARRRK